MHSLFNYESGAWDVDMLETLFILSKTLVSHLGNRSMAAPLPDGGTASGWIRYQDNHGSKFKSKLFETP
jgi:hypothetical protein